MISVADIRELAAEWQLLEEIVEKDYVLGWILWGIAHEPRLADHWVFKGGTCLKKCYIETYRFSEDLDFTVLPSGIWQPDDLRAVFGGVLLRVYRESGIECRSQPLQFKLRPGGNSTEGRVYYTGPRKTPTPARIKLDITPNECVVLPPVHREISHSYLDELPAPRTIQCYAFEEVFAEKVRAMGERCRPRDLYDIVNLYRHPEIHPVTPLIYDTLKAKCEFKSVPVPTLGLLQASPHRTELETEWENMLAHQLPALPPFDSFWQELPGLFAWLEGRLPVSVPPAIRRAVGETPWRAPATISRWGSGSPIETIRFAGANRLCIELTYEGAKRIIEPYSLRRTLDGNLVLHALRSDSHKHRSYRVDRIEGVRITKQTFQPVYQVEFSTIGPIVAPPTARPAAAIKTAKPRSKAHFSRGLVRVVQCTLCGKQFRRTTTGTKLKPHKRKIGRLDCPGRTGIFVRTQFR